MSQSLWRGARARALPAQSARPLPVSRLRVQVQEAPSVPREPRQEPNIACECRRAPRSLRPAWFGAFLTSRSPAALTSTLSSEKVSSSADRFAKRHGIAARGPGRAILPRLTSACGLRGHATSRLERRRQHPRPRACDDLPRCGRPSTRTISLTMGGALGRAHRLIISLSMTRRRLAAALPSSPGGIQKTDARFAGVQMPIKPGARARACPCGTVPRGHGSRAVHYL